MLLRIQRILAAIELFALVFWIGGLFFLFSFAAVPALQNPITAHDAVPQFADAMCKHFNSLELVLSLVVLVSNFLKAALFGKTIPLQKGALLVASFMLVFCWTYTLNLRPRMEENLELAVTAGAKIQQPDAARRYTEFRKKYELLMTTNLLLGLFMVYSFRTFEERKLHSLAKIFQAQV